MEKEVEKKEADLKSIQKRSILLESLLCIAYLLLGVVLFTTQGHCFVDAPLYWAGWVFVAGWVVVFGLYEGRLSDRLTLKEELKKAGTGLTEGRNAPPVE